MQPRARDPAQRREYGDAFTQFPNFRFQLRLAQDFPREHEACPIGSDRALDTAIITAPEARDPVLLKKLDAVAGRVLGR